MLSEQLRLVRLLKPKSLASGIDIIFRGVDLLLNTWSGPAYTGPAIGNIGAYSSKSIVVADGWDGRICDTPASSGCSNSCYGVSAILLPATRVLTNSFSVVLLDD
jgi:hypothetical protein